MLDPPSRDFAIVAGTARVAPSCIEKPHNTMPRVVYTAESEALHPRHVFPAMVRGLYQSRYMAVRLFVRDLKSDHAKSVLGLIWELVDPLVLGFIFYCLMRTRVITPGPTGIPYPLFIIYGLLLYATFMESTMKMIQLVHNAKALLAQLKLPPEALILSVILRVLFNSLFRVAVMLFFALLLSAGELEPGMRAFSLPGFLKFLALYPAIILAGASIGLLLAPFNAIFSDVGTAVRIALGPYRYLSPVLWPIPVTGAWYYANLVSPIAPILNDLRLLATHDTMQEPVAFFVRCGIYGLVFLAGWFVFHASLPVLAERA